MLVERLPFGLGPILEGMGKEHHRHYNAANRDATFRRGLKRKGGAWQRAPLGTTGYLVVSGDGSVEAAVSGTGGSAGLADFLDFFRRASGRSG